jgi:hypothetical protein
MRPLYDARIEEDLGPGDFVVQVECACGHIERLTAAMLITAGVKPNSKAQDLGSAVDEKGRAAILIRLGTG